MGVPPPLTGKLVMAFRAAFLVVSLLVSSDIAAAARSVKVDAAVIGAGECADCSSKDIRLPGLHVVITCKSADGGHRIKAAGELDKNGKFHVNLPTDLLEESGDLKENCFAHICGGPKDSPSCTATHGGPEAARIVRKSKVGGESTFGTAGKLSFTSATGAPASPWHKGRPELHPEPEPCPPPKPSFPPVYSPPPAYKPSPPPAYMPSPVYKKPPVYKPSPVHKQPPVNKPSPAQKPAPVPPSYKPPEYAPPAHKQPPAPYMPPFPNPWAPPMPPHEEPFPRTPSTLPSPSFHRSTWSHTLPCRSSPHTPGILNFHRSHTLPCRSSPHTPSILSFHRSTWNHTRPCRSSPHTPSTLSFHRSTWSHTLPCRSSLRGMSPSIGALRPMVGTPCMLPTTRSRPGPCMTSPQSKRATRNPRFGKTCCSPSLSLFTFSSQVCIGVKLLSDDLYLISGLLWFCSVWEYLLDWKRW